jgi:hypothetical protein
LGSPRRLRPGLFPSPGSKRLPSTRLPSTSITTPSSDFPCSSSSEFLRFSSSLRTFRSELCLAFRFLALFATSRVPSHFSRWLPCLRYGPSSGFLNLSTVFSTHTLAGLFHPAATSRVSLVQGLLSPRSHPPSSGGACPQAVDPRATHPLAQVAIAQGPRLRGLHPREAAFPAPQLFTTKHAAPLFEFFSSRPSLPEVGSRLPGTLRSARSPPAPALARSSRGLVSSVFSARSLASTSPSWPACSRFRA